MENFFVPRTKPLKSKVVILINVTRQNYRIKNRMRQEEVARTSDPPCNVKTLCVSLKLSKQIIWVFRLNKAATCSARMTHVKSFYRPMSSTFEKSSKHA